MSSKQWKKKLESGEEVEKKILAKIRTKYPDAHKIEGNFKYYDIEVPEVDKKIEIKYDKDSIKYGNYFIEISCNYENSGIVSTKADFWCLYDGINVVWIESSRLVALCVIEGIYWKGVPPGESSVIEGLRIPKKFVQKQSFKIESGKNYGL
jgi:hypothetical protein